MYQIKSEYATSFYSIGREYKRTLEVARLILDRETKHIVVSQLILTSIGEHSEKTKEALILLDKLYGNVPRVKLFSRQNVDGWAAWSNECKNDINLQKLVNMEDVA